MSRKDPYFSYKNKDSPEYKPQYGTKYTPRQEKILSGELLLEDIHPSELSLLVRKAKYLNDEEGFEIASLRYEEMLHPMDACYEHYTAEEAAEVLRKLTPPGFES